MRFVIVGYGRVGSRTARILRGGSRGRRRRRGFRPDRTRGASGFDACHGDGSDENVLVDAGIDGAGAIGAFTPDLNVNFAACMVGKHYGCRTVLRIDEDYREDIYERYAEDVDEIIYPERLGAAGAKPRCSAAISTSWPISRRISSLRSSMFPPDHLRSGNE